MLPGGKPRSASHNTCPFQPEVFRETRVDMVHNVEHQGTGPAGLSTKKGPFLDGHLVFKELKDQAQISPHGLRPGSNIHGTGLFKGQAQQELPPCLLGTTVRYLQSQWNLRNRMGTQLIILYGPIRNSEDHTGEIGILIFWLKELESPNLLGISASLLLEGSITFPHTLLLVVHNLVLPFLMPLPRLLLFPGWQSGLLGCRFLLLGVHFPSIPGTSHRTHGGQGLQLLLDGLFPAFTARSDFRWGRFHKRIYHGFHIMPGHSWSIPHHHPTRAPKCPVPNSGSV